MIVVENIVKFYGAYQALKNISFTINKGEIVGFLGPNGAGKTTTMRIITGYIPATKGNIIIDGHEIHDEGTIVKKRIGYMPENISLYTDMRVYNYLMFCAHLKNIPKNLIKSRIDSVIEIIGLKEYKYRIIGHLSKGYRQRVGLAQAILHDPDVLILDEPTVGLDPTQIIEIRKLIKSLSGERTVILSTHILSEVEETCERVLIIDKGELIAENSIPALKKIVDSEINAEDLEVIVASDIDKACDCLRTMAHIKYANISNVGSILVTTEEGYDMRSSVAKKLVEQNFDILEMRSKELSLEQVFLHFTKKNKQKKEKELV